MLRRLAVLGHPVGHSRSPAMQNAALADLGIADEWRYEAVDVDPGTFAERVQAMATEGFAGANVTIPHKVAALEVATDASAAAREIGAANTLTFAAEGIRADNTDASGFLAAVGDSVEGQRALILGAGGSARAVIWALIRAGAEVSIWNRTAARAAVLAADLGGTAVTTSERFAIADQCSVIVNCTSVGMAPSAAEPPSLKELPLQADAITANHLVVDLAYGGQETELVRAAKQRGARTVDGLEVLVRQGAESLRIWTGLEPSLEVMRRAARLG